MKAVLRTLVLAMLVAGVSLGQEKCKVEGAIKDQAGQALSGVSITIKSPLGNKSGSTDKGGKFSVSVLCTEQSKHTVTPAKAGYTFQPPTTTCDKYSGGPNFTGTKNGSK